MTFALALTALLSLGTPHEITAYVATCKGCTGIAANGKRPVIEHTVACPPRYPLTTRLWIVGLGVRTCSDRGGAIKGRKLDLFVESRAEALRWGRRTLTVVVLG